MKTRDVTHGLREIAVASPSSCSRRCTGIGISAGARPTRRSPPRCPEMNSFRIRPSTRPAPSPLTRHPRTSGRGSSRSATGAPASTATTCSTTLGIPARIGSCRSTNTPASAIGCRCAAKVNETTAFWIKEFAVNRCLLWEKPHSTWAWRLDPLPDGRTRLITRLKDRYSWRADPANAFLSLILFEFGDFPMMRKLLLGMKQRAESARAGRSHRTKAR
jgi:hypothetical protein